MHWCHSKKQWFPIEFNTRLWFYLYSYGTEALSHTSGGGRVQTKQTKQPRCSQDVESVFWEGWGARGSNTILMWGWIWGLGGGVCCCRTDRAIYLASQLSSMQLFVSKNSGEGKCKVERPLVKHWDISHGATETQSVGLGGVAGGGRGCLSSGRHFGVEAKLLQLLPRSGIGNTESKTRNRWATGSGRRCALLW